MLIKEFQHWLAAEAASRAMAPQLGLVFFAALDADVNVQGVIERLAREIDPENCDRLQQALQVAIEHGGPDESDLAAALETYLRASYHLGQFNGWRLAQQIGGPQ